MDFGDLVSSFRTPLFPPFISIDMVSVLDEAKVPGKHWEKLRLDRSAGNFFAGVPG